MNQRLWIPKHFLDSATGQPKSDPEFWARTTNTLGSFSHLQEVFSEDVGSLADAILESCQTPFDAYHPISNYPAINWTYGTFPCGTQASIKSSAFSVKSVLDSNGSVSQNVAYGADGLCIAQVDFAKHGPSAPGHLHMLEPGDFQRSFKEGEHSYPWQICPWPWLAVSESAPGVPYPLKTALSGEDAQYQPISVPTADDANEGNSFATAQIMSLTSTNTTNTSHPHK